MRNRRILRVVDSRFASAFGASSFSPHHSAGLGNARQSFAKSGADWSSEVIHD